MKGGEEISGIRWVWAQGDGWKGELYYLSKWPTNFRSLRGMVELVLWLACLSFYNGVFREAFIDKAPRDVWPFRGDESESKLPWVSC